MIALALLLIPSASALNVEFCIEFQTNFVDVDGGEDYWNDNANQIGRGVWLSVIDNTTDAEVFTTHWVDDETGCATLSLSLLRTYTVKTRSKAKVNGIEVQAYDDIDTPGLLETVHSSSFAPAFGNPLLLLPSTDMRLVMLSVGTWAMHRAPPPGVPSGTVIEMYNDGDGFWTNLNKVHIYDTYRNKYLIAHELGHAVSHLRDEESNESMSYAADGDGCPEGGDAHGRATKEFQSAAATEGWAHFYSALLWNNTSESSCVYINHMTSDFDLDNSPDNVYPDVVVTGYMNCEGVQTPDLETWVSSSDWLEDAVLADDDMGCGGTLTNRGNEVDWLRFWWDLSTDESISYAGALTLWDAMNPRSFDADGSTSPLSDDPIHRLDSAASMLGTTFVDAVDDQKYNGQDH